MMQYNLPQRNEVNTRPSGGARNFYLGLRLRVLKTEVKSSTGVRGQSPGGSGNEVLQNPRHFADVVYRYTVPVVSRRVEADYVPSTCVSVQCVCV